MQYRYGLWIGMAASIGACAAPTSSSETDDSIQSASTTCSALYDQCGGTYYTGPTCCAASACTYKNDYYSQCLPGSGGSPHVAACPVEGVNPTPWKGDAADRQAATIAFDLMRLAALEAQSSGNLLAARSILAPQRYTYLPGTKCYNWGCFSPGIQFDSSDPLYPHVTSAMKAALAIAQLDPNQGTYLANGLWRGYAYTDGQVYPSIFAIPALAKYKLGQSATVHLADSTSADDSHSATVSGEGWCGTYAVTITEAVNKSHSYAPIAFNNISDWRKAPSAFFGVTGGTANGQPIPNAHEPTSPFNGVDGVNPYLLVSINGVPRHWAYESPYTADCFKNTGSMCTSSLEIDPIPYTQPGAYYDAHNQIVGAQANPFSLVITNLYADPSHAGQWATRTVSGIQQWGTFSHPVNIMGYTVYQYIKQM